MFFFTLSILYAIIGILVTRFIALPRMERLSPEPFSFCVVLSFFWPVVIIIDILEKIPDDIFMRLKRFIFGGE